MERYALITGATGKIGIDLAIMYAFEDYTVIAVGRNEERLKYFEACVRGFKTKVITYCCDLTSEEEILKLYENFKDCNIEVLINCAGIGDYGYFCFEKREKYKQMIDVNILALTSLTSLFVKGMQDREYGYILNVASTASFQPGPLMSVYYASKAYVLSFSKALSVELKRDNIHVMTLCVPPTKSDSFASSAGFIERKRLFSNKEAKAAASNDISFHTFKMMQKKKEVVFYGFKFRFYIFMQRFLPTSLVTNIVYKIQKRRKVNGRRVY